MTDESLIHETDRNSFVVMRELKLLSVNYILGHVTLFHQYFHPASFIRKQIKSLMIGCSFNEVQVSRNNYIQNLFELSTLKLYLYFLLYKKSEITVQNIRKTFTKNHILYSIYSQCLNTIYQRYVQSTASRYFYFFCFAESVYFQRFAKLQCLFF